MASPGLRDGQPEARAKRPSLLKTGVASGRPAGLRIPICPGLPGVARLAASACPHPLVAPPAAMTNPVPNTLDDTSALFPDVFEGHDRSQPPPPLRIRASDSFNIIYS